MTSAPSPPGAAPTTPGGDDPASAPTGGDGGGRRRGALLVAAVLVVLLLALLAVLTLLPGAGAGTGAAPGQDPTAPVVAASLLPTTAPAGQGEPDATDEPLVQVTAAPTATG